VSGTPFATALVEHTDLGVLAAVWLPTASKEIPLGLVSDQEYALAQAESGFRALDFVGGRRALHEAFRAFGVPPVPVLVGARGEPVSPPGLTVSVSHKRGLAAALVAPVDRGTVGVDIEGGDDRQRLSIAERVLCAEEHAIWSRLPLHAQWPALQRSFSVKEAVYKAIHPHVGRYVGFQECQLTWENELQPQVHMRWQKASPSLTLDARIMNRLGYVVSSVRASKPAG
jgi:4'-phosphopantetheinyl transferase EntD